MEETITNIFKEEIGSIIFKPSLWKGKKGEEL